MALAKKMPHRKNKKALLKPSKKELESFKKKTKALSNSARYDETCRLAKKYSLKYPDEIYFKYLLAVMIAEEEVGFTEKEIKVRKSKAATELKKLLIHLKGVDPNLRSGIRNEYYWFSDQPYKQFRLGKEIVSKGSNGWYSQGVGAARLARKYALVGRKKLALRWARLAESSWKRFFKIRPDWHNAYFFYAMALGYQGKIKEMDSALQKSAKIAGKKPGWKTIIEVRKDIMSVFDKINS